MAFDRFEIMAQRHGISISNENVLWNGKFFYYTEISCTIKKPNRLTHECHYKEKKLETSRPDFKMRSVKWRARMISSSLFVCSVARRYTSVQGPVLWTQDDFFRMQSPLFVQFALANHSRAYLNGFNSLDTIQFNFAKRWQKERRNFLNADLGVGNDRGLFWS
jgi:hypothetical protein